MWKVRNIQLTQLKCRYYGLPVNSNIAWVSTLSKMIAGSTAALTHTAHILHGQNQPSEANRDLMHNWCLRKLRCVTMLPMHGNDPRHDVAGPSSVKYMSRFHVLSNRLRLRMSLFFRNLLANLFFWSSLDLLCRHSWQCQIKMEQYIIGTNQDVTKTGVHHSQF